MQNMTVLNATNTSELIYKNKYITVEIMNVKPRCIKLI